MPPGADGHLEGIGRVVSRIVAGRAGDVPIAAQLLIEEQQVTELDLGSGKGCGRRQCRYFRIGQDLGNSVLRVGASRTITLASARQGQREPKTAPDPSQDGFLTLKGKGSRSWYPTIRRRR